MAAHKNTPVEVEQDNAPELYWTPRREDERHIAARLLGATTPYTLHWGDDRRTGMDTTSTGSHLYADPGVYGLRALDAQGAVLASAPVLVAAGLEAKGIDFVASESEPGTVEVVFSAEAATGGIASEWEVLLPDATAPLLLWGAPGTRHPVAVAVGEHEFRYVNLGTKRSGSVTKTISGPSYDPDYTVAALASDTSRMTAEVTFGTLSKPGTPVKVYFDASSDPVVVTAPQTGTTATFTYPKAGTYLVSASYQSGGDPEKVRDTFVTVPFAA